MVGQGGGWQLGCWVGDVGGGMPLRPAQGLIVQGEEVSVQGLRQAGWGERGQLSEPGQRGRGVQWGEGGGLCLRRRLLLCFVNADSYSSFSSFPLPSASFDSIVGLEEEDEEEGEEEEEERRGEENGGDGGTTRRGWLQWWELGGSRHGWVWGKERGLLSIAFLRGEWRCRWRVWVWDVWRRSISWRTAADPAPRTEKALRVGTSEGVEVMGSLSSVRLQWSLR